MDDEELEAIRSRRMAELQQQGMVPGGEQSKEAKEDKLRQEAEFRNNILAQVLDQSARARLNTIAMAKPDKAKMVENMLIQMARSGQLPGKIGEEQLKGLLERVSSQTQKKTTVKFNRRRMDDSDED